jgi:hypothetical protein
VRKIIGFVFFLGFLNIAHATIIDNGAFTTDTATGLDWLDVSATVNLSYNQVNATLLGAGQLYDGWRYAVLDEVSTFIGNALNLPPGNTFATDAATIALMNTLLAELDSPMIGSDPGFVGITDGPNVDFPALLTTVIVIGGPTSAVYHPFDIHPIGPDDFSTHHVSLLVRDNIAVPAPATIILIMAGLPALVLSRPRKKGKHV